MEMITALGSVDKELDDIMDAAGENENAPCCASTKCGCVGYGYVPVQEMEEIYDTSTALTQGTVFPELDLDMSEYGCVCKQWGGVSR